MSGVASGCLRHFLFSPQPPCHRPRPPIPSQALCRSPGAGPRRRRAARRGGAGPGGPRLPADRPRGVGKTTAARILAMALNCPNRDAIGRALRRVRELPPGLERIGQSRRGRDRRRQQPRGGRRPRPAGAGHVRGLPGGPPQGLHRGRGPHADPRGLERAAQDPGGAAAGRGLRVRHHRAAEDRRRRGPGHVPAAAIRLPPDRPRPPFGTGCARC